MFYNAGRKIKTVAKTLFWIMVILNTIIAIMIGKGIGESLRWSAGELGPVLAILVPIIIIAIGVLVAWLSVLLLYAFGELCENVMSIEDDTGKINRKLDQMLNTGKTNGGTVNPGSAPKQTGKQFDPDAYPAGSV